MAPEVLRQVERETVPQAFRGCGVAPVGGGDTDERQPEIGGIGELFLPLQFPHFLFGKGAFMILWGHFSAGQPHQLCQGEDDVQPCLAVGVLCVAEGVQFFLEVFVLLAHLLEFVHLQRAGASQVEEQAQSLEEFLHCLSTEEPARQVGARTVERQSVSHVGKLAPDPEPRCDGEVSGRDRQQGVEQGVPTDAGELLLQLAGQLGSVWPAWGGP